MAELGDGQFEVDGFTFGGIWDTIKLEKVEWPEVSWDTQDTENMFRPGLMMGNDLMRPGSVDFTLRTDGYSIDDATAATEGLATVWMKGGNRNSNSISSMRYRIGNRTRRIFGRGREFVHSLDNWSYSGTSPIQCGFKMIDPFYYGDEERSVDLGYAPPVTGGLIAPLKAPLSAKGTGATGIGGYIEDVGGTAPTPVVVDVFGPTQYATIIGDTWSIQYVKPIAYDEVVTIDCRFGHMVARNNFGRVLNGNLSWKTNLAKAKITPKSEYIRYAGYDPTGLSRCRVRWRPAYHSF